MPYKESFMGIQQYWLILRRRWLPAWTVFGSVCALTIISLLLQESVYEAKGKLLIKKTSLTPSLIGGGKEIALDTSQQDNNPVDTEAEVIRSGPIIQKTINKLKLKERSGRTLKTKDFLKKLNVSDIKKTYVLQIAYQDTNPATAAEVVNTLMAAYLENNLLANRAEALAVRKFVQKQLPKAETSLHQAESDIRRFREANKVVALNKEAKSVVGIIADLQKQSQLERQLQISQSTYLLLLQKLQEIRIAENQNVGNARIIAAAIVSDRPVAPRPVLYIVTGTLLGGTLAVITALILEKIDKSIRTVDVARKTFGFALLGLIPKKKSEKLSDRDRDRSTPEIVVRDSPRSTFSQAYRMLQANLKFLNSDKELKAIVVTSSVPKEGKSTVSANLAVAMAQMGWRVLLVDADMHCPLQHKIWQLSNHLGLSNIIVGQTGPRTAIKKITANLHVLRSGVIPPNPTALLDSRRMASLIAIFRTNYEYTIIDAPSLNVAADAAILGKMTSGILLVVRPGVVDTVSAARAKEFLESSNQRVLGQVVNVFVPEKESYSYYHFLNYDTDSDQNFSPLTTARNS